MTGVLLLGVIWQVVGPLHIDYFGIDHGLYMRDAQRFLATGSPYAPWQLSGRYELTGEVFLYPPSALLLMIPFAFLPDVTWWAVPLAILGVMFRRWHISPWAWPVLGLIAFWPRTVGALVAGNTDMWIAAFLALGLEFGWPLGLVLLKPSAAPLLLAGWRRPRRTAVGAAAVGLTALLFVPLWGQYLSALANAGAGTSLLYSLPAAPLLLAPAIAWLARKQPTEIDASKNQRAISPGASGASPAPPAGDRSPAPIRA